MNTVTSGDGTTIAFDRSGEGPPLVLVGGALSDRLAAGSLTEALAPRFTVIAYDRRGRGDSGDTAPYAVEREIEDLEALVAEAGGSAFVFGHSSGAALALEASARGLPATKLALYEPPFIVDDGHEPLPDDYVERLARLAESAGVTPWSTSSSAAPASRPRSSPACVASPSGRGWRGSRTPSRTTAR
jgi:pimeloyl-ACP methyl ester carboxylesterase